MDYRALLITPLAALVLGAAAADLPMPEGWLSSTSPAMDRPGAALTHRYEVGIDTAMAGPSPSLTIRSIAPQAPQLISVGQTHQTVTGFGGQRVRFSGELRARRAGGWAGLFLGLGDGDLLTPLTVGAPGVERQLPVGAAVPAADDTWHPVSVVLDVPADAPFLTLGLAQVGEGQVWVRHLKCEAVGADVPLTTTPVGIDWAAARRFRAEARAKVLAIPPQALRNTALD